MSAKCRVCHRPLTNPAHIAAGVGPICAQRAARYSVGTGTGEQGQEQAGYPAEKLARIERTLLRLVRWLDDQQYNFALAQRYDTPEAQARFGWQVWYGLRWCRRWQDIRRQAQQLASARVAA